MIDYTYRSLFHNSSVDKQWIITDGEITLTNTDIYSEKINIEESLCSQQGNIIFGSCESNMISFTTTCLTQMVGRRITVSVTLEGGELEPFIVGTYTVTEDTLTADRQKREVIAYDDLYTINNANVADWYDSLTFPLTLKQFRDSFFAHFNVTQETTNLPNDGMTVEKTVEAEVLSGALVIQSICELNGRCGHIDRQGVFRYLPIYQGGDDVYPALTLYPSSLLLPDSERQGADSSNIPVSEYKKIEYADYEVLAIDKVQIRQEEADIGAIVGTGTNAYIVEDNFLVYGKNATDLKTVAENLFPEINKTIYTPISISCIADPCVEVGDIINVTMVNGNTISSYVMDRRITGLQSLKDNISSGGEEYQKEQLNTVNSEMIQLKGKATKIEKNVDGITTTVINDVLDPDNPQSLTSQINQAASQISAKVDEVHGDSQSSFSWELLSTGFDVKSNGDSVFKVDSTGAEITGNVKATSGYIGDSSNGFTISNSAIYNGTTGFLPFGNDGIYIGASEGIFIKGGGRKISMLQTDDSNNQFEIYDQYNFGPGITYRKRSMQLSRTGLEIYENYDTEMTPGWLINKSTAIFSVGREKPMMLLQYCGDPRTAFTDGCVIKVDGDTTYGGCVLYSYSGANPSTPTKGLRITSGNHLYPLSNNAQDIGSVLNQFRDVYANTFNGTSIIGDGVNYQLFRTTSSWKAGMYYHTIGDEAMVFANSNTRASWIFANTNPEDRTAWTSLSPAMHIKNGKVAIGKLIGSSSYLTDTLEVSGTAKIAASSDTPLRVAKTGSGNAYIGLYNNTSTNIGYYGVNTSKRAIFQPSGSGDWRIHCRQVNWTSSNDWLYYQDDAGYYHFEYYKDITLNFSTNYKGGVIYICPDVWYISYPKTISGLKGCNVTTKYSSDIMGASIHSITSTKLGIWFWRCNSGSITFGVNISLVGW